MKKYLFFVIINLLVSHSVYSEDRDYESTIKSGLVTVLNCEYNLEFHGHLSDEGTHLPGITGLYQGSCFESSDTEYIINVAGVGPGYRSFSDFGQFTITVTSINPFGSIEGTYLGVDASIGLVSGVLGGLFVGEFGTKYMTIGDVITLDDNDEEYLALYARINVVHLRKR